jgi:hypothetical protein
MTFGKEESTQWLSKGTILSAMSMVMLTLCMGCYLRNDFIEQPINPRPLDAGALELCSPLS